MRLSRRDFLKWSSLSAIGAVSCIFPDREMQMASPVELPEDLVTGRDNWYATLCDQCPEREGIIVRVMEGRAKKIQGNPLYPTNRGGQSARCEGGLQAIYHPDRLSGPMLRVGARGSGQFQPTSWTDALARVTNPLRQLQSDGNTAAMMMVTDPLRGQLARVVSGFASSFGGTHMAFEALEQLALRRAVKDVFDQDRLPDLDIDNSAYVLSFGADFLSTWVSPVRYARGYGRFRAHSNGSERGHFVHADPRYSMTAASADQWIPVTPGREGILALSIAHEIISQGHGDLAAAQAMTGGAGAAALEAFSAENVVRTDSPLYVGIPESMRGIPAAELIKKVAAEFAEKGPALAIGGGEAGAQSNGLFNLSAIYALNFLVGSVGRRLGEGGVVFNPDPPSNGLTSVPPASYEEWGKAAQDIRDRRVQVLMVRGANPVHGLPGAVGFGDAIAAGDPFVVSFSSFMDDTTLMADLVLPERLYLEDWGDDVPDPGPGYQTVGFQQPVVNPLPGLDPRSFPDLLLTLSQDLGLDDGLPNTFRDVLREEAKQLFELGRGSTQSATFEGFWNTMLQQGGWWDEAAVSNAAPPAPPNLAELAAQAPTPTVRSPGGGGQLFQMVPFLSNSLLDGRGAHLPWLQATPDPMTSVTWQTWVEINSQEARKMGLEEGDVVRLVSSEGSVEAVVYPHPAMPPWVVGVPVGQGHAPGIEYASRDGEPRGSNPISILAPEVEPATGSLAWGATQVRVEATGRSMRVSKFEGIVPAFPIGVRGEDIVQVARE